jgi:RHS repeat-associated protein
MSRRGARGGSIAAAFCGGLLVASWLPVESVAQQGKPKGPPQLPPQASEKARQAVSEHTAPSVSLTTPAANALYTAPAAVLLQATATASSNGRSIARVEFFAGTTSIGAASMAPYTLDWSNVAAGSYALTARATDSLGVTATSAPIAIVVNAPPTVSLSSPAGDATFKAPASIPLTADVTDTDGTIAQVEFYSGATLIGTRTAPPYSIAWTDVPQGTYSVTARVTDNHGAVTTSAPVGVTVNSAVAQIHFIHTDHLNTPRLITNNVGEVVWSWANDDPFGANVPNENPSGLGAFTCNLRLPGQYFDRETSLHYNYFRDYGPAMGRYVQSDPIGLAGGINTFAYVSSNPLAYSDPYGLDRTVWRGGPGRSAFSDGPRNGNWCGGDWSGGQVPSRNQGRDGGLPPMDSLDSCCMAHDNCYGKCRNLAKGVQQNCFIKCDRGLVTCLTKLDDDCTKWPNPPRKGTEVDSQFYRDDAIRIFTQKVRQWEQMQRQRR